MNASLALVSGKVRITDHLFLLISLKKHVSRCPPVPPVNAAVGRAAVGVVALGARVWARARWNGVMAQPRLTRGRCGRGGGRTEMYTQ